MVGHPNTKRIQVQKFFARSSCCYVSGGTWLKGRWKQDICWLNGFKTKISGNWCFATLRPALLKKTLIVDIGFSHSVWNWFFIDSGVINFSHRPALEYRLFITLYSAWWGLVSSAWRKFCTWYQGELLPLKWLRIGYWIRNISQHNSCAIRQSTPLRASSG